MAVPAETIPFKLFTYSITAAESSFGIACPQATIAVPGIPYMTVFVM